MRICADTTKRKSQIFKDGNGNRTTVPFHSGKILHPKLLKSIMNEANLSIENLKKYL